MTENRMKRLLAEGRVPVGLYWGSESLIFAEVLGQTGVDFVVIETEHGPLNPMVQEPLASLCRMFQSYEVTPLVRVPSNDPQLIGSALDAGALGVVVPHVRGREDAVRMVEATRFPPEGVRGCGPLVPANHFVGPFNEYISKSNETIIAAPLIEDPEGVKNLDEILEVPGIDFVMFGPLDFAFSSGLCDFMHPEVQATRSRVIDACRARNVPVDIGSNPDELRTAAEQGSRVVAILGTDLHAFQQACSTAVGAARAALEAGGAA